MPSHVVFHFRLTPLTPLSAWGNLRTCGRSAERGEPGFRGEGGSLASPFPPEETSPPPGSRFRAGKPRGTRGREQGVGVVLDLIENGKGTLLSLPKEAQWRSI
jgi:hypothetical protein